MKTTKLPQTAKREVVEQLLGQPLVRGRYSITTDGRDLNIQWYTAQPGFSFSSYWKIVSAAGLDLMVVDHEN
jgi:hypothetical protein